MDSAAAADASDAGLFSAVFSSRCCVAELVPFDDDDDDNALLAMLVASAASAAAAAERPVVDLLVLPGVVDLEDCGRARGVPDDGCIARVDDAVIAAGLDADCGRLCFDLVGGGLAVDEVDLAVVGAGRRVVGDARLDLTVDGWPVVDVLVGDVCDWLTLDADGVRPPAPGAC